MLALFLLSFINRCIFSASSSIVNIACSTGLTCSGVDGVFNLNIQFHSAHDWTFAYCQAVGRSDPSHCLAFISGHCVRVGISSYIQQMYTVLSQEVYPTCWPISCLGVCMPALIGGSHAISYQCFEIKKCFVCQTTLCALYQNLAIMREASFIFNP